MIRQSNFALQLRFHRERSGLSCNQLARAVGIDPSYVSRIERGERDPPRRPLVIAFADAMKLSGDERDSFCVSAGYAASYHLALDPDDTVLVQDIANLLSLHRLSPESLTHLRTALSTILAQWQYVAIMENEHHGKPSEDQAADRAAEDRGYLPTARLAN